MRSLSLFSVQVCSGFFEVIRQPKFAIEISDTMNIPRLGVGIYIIRDGKVLIGKRKGNLEPGTWCSPGGKVEWGEEPADTAVREALEESGVSVKNVRFVGYTNDWDELKQHHYITLAYVADWASGEPRVCEPDKCEEWGWYSWDALPEPQFIGLRKFVEKGYNPVTS